MNKLGSIFPDNFFIKSMLGLCILLAGSILLVSQPALAQDSHIPDPGKLNSAHLVPNRLRLDLGSFLSDKFNTPEVYISLERTHYYLNDQAKEAIRVRWVANTHSHEDEVLLDAETMSIFQIETPAAGIRDLGRTMAFVDSDSIKSITFKTDGTTSSSEAPWEENGAFHLMMLPYFFASLDSQPGEEYALPSFSPSTGKKSIINVNVNGPTDENPAVWHFESDHGWVKIDWYIDSKSPPYLDHMVWNYVGGPFDGQAVKQKVSDWSLFENDIFENVIK